MRSWGESKAPEMKDVENRLFASELRCAIYSVDHRLAPESPHPAPVEDIYSVFAWLHANASQLGLDPARIGIKGESGGGGFAAAAKPPPPLSPLIPMRAGSRPSWPALACSQAKTE